MGRAVDIAVIGGGLIGSAIAWGAQRDGSEVALLDEGDVAYRAARGNFGLVWLQGKGVGVPPYMRWSLRAGNLWPDFAAALEAAADLEIGWRRCGGFHFCLSELELDDRKGFQARSAAEGASIAIDILDRRDLRQLFPRVGECVAGASFSPADGQVNPLRLLRALQRALQGAGGRYVSDCKVTSVAPDGDGFRIDTAAGPLTVRRVVLTAGLGSVGLAPALGLDLPLRPERGQIVVTERLKPFFPHVADCLQQTLEGTVLLGSSHEDVGFNEGTEVGAVAGLARRAVAVFPALAAANIVRCWGSLRVMSPDGLPIYQESPRHPGAFAVTCHSGVTLASVHALEIGPAIARGVLPDALAPFGTGRFHVPTA